MSEAARNAADKVKALLRAGSFVIFKGELKDNGGNVVIPAGKGYPQAAIQLESMNYLVEGVHGRS